MTLIHTDNRFGDRYEIDLDSTGKFAHAKRFVDRIKDAIHYTSLSEIPSPHREQIQDLIQCQR
jgi:hypothetical protein